MSCCNECLQWCTNKSNRNNPAPQGHHLCNVPSSEEKEWFKAGSYPEFVNGRWTIGPPRVCVCDYPDRSAMTMEQWKVADGHFNQAGGYCCSHHGNTCGHCHQYENC